VVAADPQRPAHQRGHASGGVGVVQLGHQGGLGHGHVVQDPEAADDDAGQQQPSQRQPADDEVGAEGLLAGQPGEGGGGDKGDG
jgi:hypothetical protein